MEPERLEIIAEIGYQNHLYVLTNDGYFYRPISLPAVINPFKNNQSIRYRKVTEPSLIEKLNSLYNIENLFQNI